MPVGLPSITSLLSIDMDPARDVVPGENANGADMLCLLMGTVFFFFCLLGLLVKVVGRLSTGGMAIVMAGLGIVRDGRREKKDEDSS